MDNIINKIRIFLKRKDAGDNVKPWIRWYSRIGFSAKGFVYILIGLISMMTAVGIGEKNGKRGAIAAIASKPYGEAILWFVVLGLTGYITWLVTQVLIEPDYHGSKFKGFFIRVGYFFSASFYVGLGIKFAMIAIHSGHTGHQKELWMGKALDIPIGRFAIGITGISIVIFAVIQALYGIRGTFTNKLKTRQMRPKEWFIMKLIGRIGFVARGITFGVLGGFLMHSGWTSESSQAMGIDGALAKIADEPYGQLLLGIISLGLFLYGVFEVLEGKNRNIRIKR
ncbi:hypothetical protein CFK37_03270 [Virgibacillus phasianinus]|uniref:DUF1206 domain-containing protein n=1 Tax=Virgibacillus phasianinus TaxID=2017483 RepID=A0A220TZK5_9BACI|nr:DUF1206 domain-containing protein [Virgibacillus phasianinus]ASK61268.1 hypothetical protein CFK37_03270 [Virgibacillus phasianinus]